MNRGITEVYLLLGYRRKKKEIGNETVSVWGVHPTGALRSGGDRQTGIASQALKEYVRRGVVLKGTKCIRS